MYAKNSGKLLREIHKVGHSKMLSCSPNSVDLICSRLARSSRYVEEQRNLQLSCEPTWLMVATYVAICCFDEICSRGRWYSYSIRLKIIVATEHYTPSTGFIDTTHAQHAEDQKQPARAAALTYEIKPEDVTRTIFGIGFDLQFNWNWARPTVDHVDSWCLLLDSS